MKSAGPINRETWAPCSGNQGRYDEALDLYVNALAVFEESGDRLKIANQCTNIGYIHVMRGEPHIALEWYKRALPLFEAEQENTRADGTRRNIEILVDHSKEKRRRT